MLILNSSLTYPLFWEGSRCTSPSLLRRCWLKGGGIRWWCRQAGSRPFSAAGQRWDTYTSNAPYVPCWTQGKCHLNLFKYFYIASVHAVLYFIWEFMAGSSLKDKWWDEHAELHGHYDGVVTQQCMCICLYISASSIKRCHHCMSHPESLIPNKAWSVIRCEINLAH